MHWKIVYNTHYLSAFSRKLSCLPLNQVSKTARAIQPPGLGICFVKYRKSFHTFKSSKSLPFPDNQQLQFFGLVHIGSHRNSDAVFAVLPCCALLTFKAEGLFDLPALPELVRVVTHLTIRFGSARWRPMN